MCSLRQSHEGIGERDTRITPRAPGTLSLVGILILAVALAVAAPVHPTAADPRSPGESARDYLAETSARYGLTTGVSDLRTIGIRSSLTGDHVQLQQTANGVPVFGSTITVSLPRDGREPIVRSRYSSLPVEATGVTVTGATARAVAVDRLGATPDGSTEVVPAELVYFPVGKALKAAWQLILRTTQPYGTWLVISDAATGETLYHHDLLQFDSGRVFDPNPAQSNGGISPAPHCDNATNEGLLSGQYMSKILQGIAPAQNKLKGEWVDLTAPGITTPYKSAGQANEPSRNYIYGCNDDRFEEAMIYYHLDRTQRKIQALGFTGGMGVVHRSISAHAHFMPDCNAFFDPTTRGLHYGDFDGPGVFPGSCAGNPALYDSGEDADWIIHEYGHAIQDDITPGYAFGPYPLSEQAGAIGEGFSDFLAAVMNDDPCWGEYVTLGASACGGLPGARWLQNENVYPADFEACPDVDYNGVSADGAESEEVHCGGQVWGGALWDLLELIGGGLPTQQARDIALTLVLESQFYLDQQASFNEAAAAICLADSILYDGSHAVGIGAAFSGRGISSAACTSSDFPSLYYRVLHPYSGDLDLNLKVGPGVDTGTPPVCSFSIGDPDLQLDKPDLYVNYLGLTPPTCSALLPPSVAQPWWLEAKDTLIEDEGRIADFEVMLPGGTRCIAADLPVVIPDFGSFVYAKVDCTNQVTPPSSTPTPIPGANAFGNVDCSGFINSIDALKLLRAGAGLPYTQTEPCANIGTETLPNGELQGDIDCSGAANAVDALKLLRYTASLPVIQNEPCPDIGS